MSIRLIAFMKAHPGRTEELISTLDSRIPGVLAEPGCEGFELFRSTTRPDTLVLIEQWSSPETMAAHSAMNKTRPIPKDVRASVQPESYRTEDRQKL